MTKGIGEDRRFWTNKQIKDALKEWDTVDDLRLLRKINSKFFCGIFHDHCNIKSEKNCAYCLRKLRRI